MINTALKRINDTIDYNRMFGKTEPVMFSGADQAKSSCRAISLAQASQVNFIFISTFYNIDDNKAALYS